MDRKRRDINKHNRAGTNKLFDAIDKNSLEDVKYLLECGAKINVRTIEPRGFIGAIQKVGYTTGSTPLHAACLLGHLEITKTLLRYGPDINATNGAGFTPLDYALMGHDFEEKRLEKIKVSPFAFGSAKAHAEERLRLREEIVLCLQQAGARSSYLALGRKFDAAASPAPAIEDLPPRKPSLKF